MKKTSRNSSSYSLKLIIESKWFEAIVHMTESEFLDLSCHIFFYPIITASSPLLSTWPCTLKSDEEKSIYAGLAEEYSFPPCIFAQFPEAGKNCSTALHMLEKRRV